MKEQFIRTAMLLGEEGIACLQDKRVAVFGIGGVGGHAIEALVRSGIGALDLIDNDVVSISNLNRQIVATHDTIGRPKTEVMKERIQSIQPDCRVRIYNTFYLPEERDKFPFAEYDYIIDAIDTVTAKLDLAVVAQQMGIPIISSMGTGNKLDPTQLEVTDIYKTSVCPLAKVMRKELKARGVTKLKVVYSKEQVLKPLHLQEQAQKTIHPQEQAQKPIYPQEEAIKSLPIQEAIKPLPIQEEPNEAGGNTRRATPGSTAFVPAVAGLILAGEVIRELANTGHVT